MRAQIIARWVVILLSLCHCTAQDWISELADSVTGRVVTAPSAAETLLAGVQKDVFIGDQGYKADAVLLPATEQDIVIALQITSRANVTIAVKGGAGAWINHRVADQGLSVDMSSFANVTVDPASLTLTAQGGAVGGDMLVAAEPYGLVMPWGDAPVTGMGLALIGGIGMAMREHGLVCDNMLRFRLALGNGSVVEVDEASQPELFQAMRGAGTVFGIVMEVTFRLYDAEGMVSGMYLLPDDDNLTVFRALTEFTEGVLAQYPGLGIEVISLTSSMVLYEYQFWGPQSESEKYAVFEPLWQSYEHEQVVLGANSTYAVGMVEASGAIFSQSDGLKIFLLDWLLTEDQYYNGGLDGMIAGMRMASSLVNITVLLTDWLGTNATTETDSYTAFAGKFMHFFIAMELPSDSAALIDAAVAVQSAVQQFIPEEGLFLYPNLATDPDPSARLADFVGGEEKLAQLRGLKQRFDPGNRITNHQLVGLV